MSKQLRFKINSKVGIPRVAMEVSIPGGEAVPNQGIKRTFTKTWHPGDIFYLSDGETLVIRPPAKKKVHEFQISLTETPGNDVGLICSDRNRYWRLFVTPIDDTGTNA